ncbi:hypothetical protein [Ignicoccus hospitalis]|uniref:Major facilitator superfamily MFS_1 n=1 Tax=Ignicoccus hospitalis (strain KIN4/I / DSM 18386 / JCM 14125) TaxID=453591 RepID=A8A9J0_IGNH4|nr:hypothetical protein [Ignicoccus hospitalis]ABU81592.1 hypothetical protein Igni_0409 [Ignicoccus hospitalis KIN4/I]HIH90528.1 MFS transporter [Desulfurococcaceae archaeon]
MRKRLLLLGIALLSLGYGYYTTAARVSGDVSEAGAVAVAELASAASATFFGWLADKKGMRKASLAAPLAGPLSALGLDPLSVFLTLSFFYSAFVVALLAANEAGPEELGASVGALSLGWGAGVALVPYFRGPQVPAASFFAGSLAVVAAVPDVPGRANFLAAVPKLKRLVPPLAAFMGAEYLSYALTAWRFYELADPTTFVLSYAVGPGVTAFLGGLVAGRALERFGPERVLLGSLLAYPFVVALALLAPPPACFFAWSVPVYPFYEAGLVATVTKFVPEAKGASLGLTYTTMALSSFLMAPLTRFKDVKVIATISITLMLISTIIIKRIICPPSRARRRASPRP